MPFRHTAMEDMETRKHIMVVVKQERDSLMSV